MIQVLHNPRCAKSREAIALLTEKNINHEVVLYLQGITEAELTSIVKKLAIKPVDLVRTNEAVWKTNFKGKSYTDEELISIMVAEPKLIERPIVIHQERAVVARPAQLILQIL